MEDSIDKQLIRVKSSEQLQSQLNSDEHVESIAQLNKEIIQLCEMFNSLNEVVHNQDPQIETITENVSNTKQNVDVAKTELIEAKTYQDSSHKLLLGGTVVMTLIGGPTFLGIKTTIVIVSGLCATAFGYNLLNK